MARREVEYRDLGTMQKISAQQQEADRRFNRNLHGVYTCIGAGLGGLAVAFTVATLVLISEQGASHTPNLTPNPIVDTLNTDRL